MKLFNMFRANRNELLDIAVTRMSRLDGIAQEFETLSTECANLLQKVDHNTDWWRWAELKQRQADALDEWAVANVRYKKARSQYEALLADANKPVT